MTLGTALAIIAIIGAIAPLYSLAKTLKQNADRDYVTRLEKENERFARELEARERERDACRERSRELADEVRELTRQLLAGGAYHHPKGASS